MAIFNTAKQLIGPGEIGLCLNTDGTYFVQNADGSGSSARWRVNPKRRVDKVIVFKQELSAGRWIAKLFTAQRTDCTPLNMKLYQINLKNIKHVGITDKTWQEFAGVGRNGIRYVP